MTFRRDGKFESRCNKEMVELVPLSSNDDCNFVKDLLQDFVTETGSEVAKSLLGNWQSAKEQFVKVFPYEYQRALRDMEEQVWKINRIMFSFL